MITINVKCPVCGNDYAVEVPREGYNRWIDGEHIQDAMPDVSPEVRESLISGVCENCWANLFGGYDDDAWYE